MFGMKGFYVSASGAIQGHHGPLVSERVDAEIGFGKSRKHWKKGENSGYQHFLLCHNVSISAIISLVFFYFHRVRSQSL